MLWHVKDSKIIIKIVPKTACTTIKRFLFELKNVPFKNPHDPNSYVSSEFFITEEDAYNILSKDVTYKFCIVVRNPYDRFFSGLNQKFICHHPNNHEEEYKKKLVSTSNPKIANFYKWFKKNVSNDFSLITTKYLIDYHTDPEIIKKGEIDNHFLNIYDHNMPFKNILDKSRIIVIKNEDNLIYNLNKLFRSNIEIPNENVSIYNVNELQFVDIHKSCCSDKRIKNDKYFINKVNKAFYNDFIHFGYELQH